MSCEELEIVWNNIKAEARTLADCEPMLASFYHATLLKHENLGSALSYMLANKLSSPIMPAIAIREVVEEAYAADPEMIASAACDRYDRPARHENLSDITMESSIYPPPGRGYALPEYHRPQKRSFPGRRRRPLPPLRG
ncbi:hypothetical protein AWF91_05855 [Escherichia coli]|nr:hypothetical protein AWF91_05855 [Escherichia coli]